MSFKNHFKLKRACGNCPFRKQGAIELSSGRLEGIASELLHNDMTTFQCHKTVHNARTGGEFNDDGEYQASGRESMCVGAIIYLEKIQSPTVGMRLARTMGIYHPDNLTTPFDEIIDNIELKEKRAHD